MYEQCCDPGVTWQGTTHGKVGSHTHLLMCTMIVQTVLFPMMELVSSKSASSIHSDVRQHGLTKARSEILGAGSSI